MNNGLTNSIDFLHGTTTTISYGNTVTYAPMYLKMPTKVNFHPDQGVTVLYFGKDKVVVRTSEGDTFDPKVGFLTAYFQYQSGLSKKKANDFIHNLSKGDK